MVGGLNGFRLACFTVDGLPCVWPIRMMETRTVALM